MSKGFISNIFLIVLLNVLIKPFYIFGIDAQIQNHVGFEDYGLYFSLFNLSFLFNIILDFGINNYNAKNIAQHPVTLTKYLGSLIGLRITLALLFIFITLGSAFLLGYSGKAIHLLVFLCLNQILGAFVLYFRSNFAGLHNFKVDAILSVLDRLILIILCASVLYASILPAEISIENFIYAQSISYGIAALTGLILTLRLTKVKLKIKKYISFALLKSSFPYALLILLMMLYTRTDAIMIERLLDDGKEQTGMYAAGFRILDAANIFPFLVAGILLPMFARLLKNKEDLSEIIRTASSLMIPVALVCSTLCFIYAEELLPMIYEGTSAETVECFQLLILNFIPISTTYIFGTLLTANGSLKILNIMAISGFIVNLVLNFTLIPIWGAIGAALATLITQTLAAVAQYIMAKSKINFHIPTRFGIGFIFLPVLLVLFNFLAKDQFHFSINILISAVISLILLFLLNIFNVKSIVGLVKSKF